MAKETLQQIQERRRNRREKAQAQKQSVKTLDPGISDIELPVDQQDSGQDKLNKLLFNKALLFVAGNLTVVDQVLEAVGLPNSESLKELKTKGETAVNDFIANTACANKETLLKAVKVRNALNEELGKLGSYYNLTNDSINKLSSFLTGQLEATKLLKAARDITSQAAKVIPTPPGVPGIIPATLNDISSVVDVILFTAIGTPKLTKAKSTVDTGLMYLAMSSQTLLKLLEPLQVLDRLLEKCGETVEPIPDSINQFQAVYLSTQRQPSSENYKGFTLEIVEVPFSETVTRRKAVGKNPEGITLVETPLSFTTLEQVLLNQLKFTIDSQNLKPF